MGLKISYSVGVAFLLILAIVAIAFWWFVPSRAEPTAAMGALAPRIEQTKSGIAVTGMYAARDTSGNLVLPVFVWKNSSCSATFPMAEHDVAVSENWNEYEGLHTSIRTHGRLSLTLPNDRSSVEGEIYVRTDVNPPSVFNPTPIPTPTPMPTPAAGYPPTPVPTPTPTYTKLISAPLEKVYPRRDDNMVTVSLERGSTAAFPGPDATRTPFANDYRAVDVVLRVDDVDQAECEAITATAFWEDLGSATVYVHPSSNCDDIPDGGDEGDQLTKESDNDCDVMWEAEETVRIYYGKMDTPDIIGLASLTAGNITGSAWSLGVYDIPVVLGHYHMQVRVIPGIATDDVRFVLAVPTSIINTDLELRDYALHDWIGTINTSYLSSTLQIENVPYTAYAVNTVSRGFEHTYVLIFGDN